MKRIPAFLLSLVIFAAVAATSAFADEFRGGIWWQHQTYLEKDAWVGGWFDGIAAGELIVGGINGTPKGDAPYNSVLINLLGVTSGEIIQGMDEFYAADFRNLPVGAGAAALLVVMYAKTPAGVSVGITRMTELLRARYRNGKVIMGDSR